MIDHERVEVPFRQFTTLLRRQWRLIAGSVLLAFVAALLLGFSLPPRYTAKAQLLVSQADTSPTEKLDETIVDTHVALLVSPSHLRRVWENYSVQSQPRVHDLYEDPLGDWGVIDDLLPEAEGPISFKELQEGLNVYKERFSRVISITFTSTSPQMAATIANMVGELYVQAGRDRAQAEHDAAKALLSERIPAARAELETAEAALRRHQLASGLIDTAQLEAMDLQIADLRSQLVSNASELAEYDRQLALLANLQGQEGGATSLFEALQNPRLAKFRSSIVIPASNASASVSEPDETVRREDVNEVAEQVISLLTLERDAIKARGFRIREQLEFLEASREETREPERQLRNLERKSMAATQLYESLLQRRTDMAARGAVAADTHVVSVASVPELPSSPSPALFILPAIVIAGIVGGFASVLVEHLDHRLRSERDIERELGLNCIGLVPRAVGVTERRLQEKLINRPFDPYTEATRSVVTAAFMQLPHEPMVFLVTSSQRREGKTTLAISFAVYAALLRRRVLLIDLNFHNPSVSGALESLDDNSTKDKQDGSTANETIKKIPSLGIDYLPISKNEGYPLSILSTDWLPNILNELKKQYECIVIDSAPLLGTSEARLFASLADKVILAVKWGAIEPDIARGALQQLRHAGIENVADFVSAVVTQVDMRKHVFCRYGSTVGSVALFPDQRLPRIPRVPMRSAPPLRSPAA